MRIRPTVILPRTGAVVPKDHAVSRGRGGMNGTGGTSGTSGAGVINGLNGLDGAGGIGKERKVGIQPQALNLVVSRFTPFPPLPPRMAR